MRPSSPVPTFCPSSLSLPKDSCSSGSGASSPQDKIADGILLWNSYKEFSKFYSSIGIMFNSSHDVKFFFDIVRAQHNLPVVNLDLENDCVEQLRSLLF